jgi:iron(II)-dependent oxidoreductase
MSSAETVSSAPGQATALLAELDEARAETLALVGGLADAQLERVFSPLMSPLVWDLGHIASYEDLWLAHRRGVSNAS